MQLKAAAVYVFAVAGLALGQVSSGAAGPSAQAEPPQSLAAQPASPPPPPGSERIAGIILPDGVCADRQRVWCPIFWADDDHKIYQVVSAVPPSSLAPPARMAAPPSTRISTTTQDAIDWHVVVTGTVTGETITVTQVQLVAPMLQRMTGKVGTRAVAGSPSARRLALDPLPGTPAEANEFRLITAWTEAGLAYYLGSSPATVEGRMAGGSFNVVTLVKAKKPEKEPGAWIGTLVRQNCATAARQPCFHFVDDAGGANLEITDAQILGPDWGAADSPLVNRHVMVIGLRQDNELGLQAIYALPDTYVKGPSEVDRWQGLLLRDGADTIVLDDLNRVFHLTNPGFVATGIGRRVEFLAARQGAWLTPVEFTDVSEEAAQVYSLVPAAYALPESAPDLSLTARPPVPHSAAGAPSPGAASGQAAGTASVPAANPGATAVSGVAANAPVGGLDKSNSENSLDLLEELEMPSQLSYSLPHWVANQRYGQGLAGEWQGVIVDPYRQFVTPVEVVFVPGNRIAELDMQSDSCDSELRFQRAADTSEYFALAGGDCPKMPGVRLDRTGSTLHWRWVGFGHDNLSADVGELSALPRTTPETCPECNGAWKSALKACAADKECVKKADDDHEKCTKVLRCLPPLK